VIPAPPIFNLVPRARAGSVMRVAGRIRAGPCIGECAIVAIFWRGKFSEYLATVQATDCPSRCEDLKLGHERLNSALVGHTAAIELSSACNRIIATAFAG